MNAGEARLVLVRHGETEWNLQGRIQGFHADSPLSDIGRSQALAVAERLAKEGIDLLFASDLGRTRATAEPIARAAGVELVLESNLRERNYGIFEGRTFSEIQADYPEDYERMRARDPQYKAPGGESAIEFHERIVCVMEQIAARSAGMRAAIVTHQGVLGVLYRHVKGLSFNEPHRPKLLNASCNHFRYDGTRWVMDAWCDVAHLPESAAGA